jgi:hypothetical protein
MQVNVIEEQAFEMPTDLDLALGVQLRIFDPQLCDSIDLDWLKNSVADRGVSADEVESFVADGIVRRWRSPNGIEGFLLYSERQVRVAKALQDTGRYKKAELLHFFEDWNVMLEICMIEHLAYDSFDISDYEHFRRRSAQDAAHFKSELDLIDIGEAEWMGEHQKEQARQQFDFWTRWHERVTVCEDEELSHKNRLGWRKALAHQRWVDEFVRTSTGDNVGKLLERGYSSEVTFNGYTESEAGTEFTHLSWRMTLQRFKDTINEGHDFPLRTPDFSITRGGIVFSSFPTPEKLAELQETYKLDELRGLLDEWGAKLWECDLAASGRAECPACGKPFERTKASRKFCGDTCRNRAKARKYRENNPEKVDAARARYYE